MFQRFNDLKGFGFDTTKIIGSLENIDDRVDQKMGGNNNNMLGIPIANI